MRTRLKRIVPDTGVLSEYVVKRAPYRSRVEELFSLAALRKIELLLGHLTISETIYVVTRIYQEASVSEADKLALDFLSWIKPKCKMVSTTKEIAIQAGELKKRIKIALPDCYVIATAKAYGGVPLFRKVEAEMEPFVGYLKGIGVQFLDDERWSLA